MAEKLMTDGSMALREKQYRVITIEATEKPQNAKLRVAAYARVSSASDDQLNSFAAQNRHYSDLISSKENWRMVDIYADEGITGTSAEKREDFQRLLADCRRGLIDRVLVKIHLPLCPQYQGMPGNHQRAEIARCRRLLREREH